MIRAAGFSSEAPAAAICGDIGLAEDRFGLENLLAVDRYGGDELAAGEECREHYAGCGEHSGRISGVKSCRLR